jgi:hypothetical protein
MQVSLPHTSPDDPSSEPMGTNAVPLVEPSARPCETGISDHGFRPRLVSRTCGLAIESSWENSQGIRMPTESSLDAQSERIRRFAAELQLFKPLGLPGASELRAAIFEPVDTKLACTRARPKPRHGRFLQQRADKLC